MPPLRAMLRLFLLAFIGSCTAVETSSRRRPLTTLSVKAYRRDDDAPTPVNILDLWRLSNDRLNFDEQTRDTSRATKVPVAAGLGAKCTDDGACSNVRHSRCAEGLCACDRGFVPFAQRLCIPMARYLGDKCDTAQQCKHLNPSAVCYVSGGNGVAEGKKYIVQATIRYWTQTGHCICEPFFRVTGQRCNPDYPLSGMLSREKRKASSMTCLTKSWIGEACCDSRQCSHQVPHSQCVDERCVCQTGFVNVSSYHCAKKAVELGDPCAFNVQCQDVVGSECHRNGICWTDDEHVPLFQLTKDSANRQRRQTGNRALRKRHLFDLPCEIGRQCTAWTRNSGCDGGTCQCVDAFPLHRRVDLCLPFVNDLSNSRCSLDEQCTVAGASCNSTTHQCNCPTADFCQQGSSTCASKVAINGSCSTDCECSKHKGVCTDGKCVCATCMTYDSKTQQCCPLTLFPTELSPSYRRVRPCCADVDRYIGRVTANGASTCTSTTVSYSGDTSAFTFEAVTGQIVRPASAEITTTATLTATLSCNTCDTLSAVLTVIIIPDPCCLAQPSATALLTNAITIDLVDPNNAGNGRGCAGINAASNQDRAVNRNGILTFAARSTINTGNSARGRFNLFNTAGPCGNLAVEGAALGSGCGSDLFRIDPPAGNSVDYISVTGLTAGSGITCPIDLTLRTCAFVTRTYKFTLTLQCPAGV